MQDMILIVTPSTSGPQCAELIGKALNREANLVTSVRQAVASVRSAEYRVIVMDEDLFEVNPAASCQSSRTGRWRDYRFSEFRNRELGPRDSSSESGAAKKRARRDEATGRHSASLQHQGELSNDLTGILVSVQTAMSTPDLPGPVQERLSNLYEIARKLQLRLQAS